MLASLISLGTAIAQNIAACVLKCRSQDPSQGSDYDVCVDGCFNGNLAILRSAPGRFTADPEDFTLAFVWAETLLDMQSAGSDPNHILRSLEVFFEAEFEDDVRERFVVPFTVGLILDLAADEAVFPGWAVLQETSLNIVLGERFSELSNGSRTAFLALATLADELDNHPVISRTAEEFGLTDAVGEAQIGFKNLLENWDFSESDNIVNIGSEIEHTR